MALELRRRNNLTVAKLEMLNEETGAVEDVLTSYADEFLVDLMVLLQSVAASTKAGSRVHTSSM